MSNVTSKPLESTTDRPRGAAPLPRGWIDDALPVARTMFGAAFVAFSGWATIRLFAMDIQPLIGDAQTIGIMLDRYWLGLLLALSLFIGQVMTAESAPSIYGAILIPDTWYTARQMYPGLVIFLAAYGGVGCGILAGVTVWGLLMAEGKQGRMAAIVGVAAGLTLWFIIESVTEPAWVRVVLAWVFAGVNGYLVARFGELLLFGRRRGKR